MSAPRLVLAVFAEAAVARGAAAAGAAAVMHLVLPCGRGDRIPPPAAPPLHLGPRRFPRRACRVDDVGAGALAEIDAAGVKQLEEVLELIVVHYRRRRRGGLPHVGLHHGRPWGRRTAAFVGGRTGRGRTRTRPGFVGNLIPDRLRADGREPKGPHFRLFGKGESQQQFPPNVVFWRSLAVA